MKRLPQIALLPDGKRLHLQDGPIDLIVEAKGQAADVHAAYAAAAQRIAGAVERTPCLHSRTLSPQGTNGNH